MDARATIEAIVALGPRGACSDGERRAAVLARDTLRADGREAHIETFWTRPQWAPALVFLAALIVAGSLASVWQAEVGLSILGFALLGLAAELTGRTRLLRLLWPARATQNVVSPPAEPRERRTRLIVTANLDAGRGGSASRLQWSGRAAETVPGAPALLWFALALLCLLAALRVAGHAPRGLAVLQFALTVFAILLFAALADTALANVSPGANVNASGAALALALVRELDRATLRALDVELVLTGAGDRQALGFERYMRGRRHQLDRRGVVVLELLPCGAGIPSWLERDGQLLPLRLHPRLGELMTAAAARESHLGARPRRAWNASAAYAARRAGWPAIALGAMDADGRVPHAYAADDTRDAIDSTALATTLELCLAFTGVLDADLARAQAPATTAS